MPTNTIIAFDLYGTLLSTASIAKDLAVHFGEEKAASLAALWRRYQLEYTWRLNSMTPYQPFSDITRNSLHHALADSSLFLDNASTTQLMQAYDNLSTFPDVAPALKTLATETRFTPVVFSNGTHAMVTNSVRSSPDLAPHEQVFEAIVTVDEVRCFKPHPRVYGHLAKMMGVGEEMGRVWVVSGNPFDVVGGGGGGLVGGEMGGPDVVVRGLGEVVQAVREYSGLV
ncbi:HAD-like domain-containing protein [Usnea florida]